jgi:hypothetical protein
MRIVKLIVFITSIIFIIALILSGSLWIAEKFPHFLDFNYHSVFGVFFLLVKMFGLLAIPVLGLVAFIKFGVSWIEK